MVNTVDRKSQAWATRLMRSRLMSLTLFSWLHDVAIEEAMKHGLKPAELVIPHAKLINGIIGSEDGKIPGLKET